MSTTQDVSKVRKPVINKVWNGNFELAPAFTAATTTGARWIDGTAAGSNATSSVYGWALGVPATSSSGQFDSTVSYSGTYSLKLSNTNTTGRARGLLLNASNYSGVTHLTADANLIRVVPSTSYTLTARVKTNNVPTNGAYIQIVEINGQGALGTVTSSSALTGTNDWTLVTVTVTVASTARYVGIGLNNDVAGNVCDAWFDEVTFDITAGTSRLTAGARTTAAAAGAISLFNNGNFGPNYIVPSDQTKLNVGLSSDFSVGAYVYLYKKTFTNNSDNHGIASCNFNFGSDKGYLFDVHPTNGSLIVFGGATQYTSSTGLVPYNQYTYVIFTLTGTTLKGYVDGALVWTQTITRKDNNSSIVNSNNFLAEVSVYTTNSRHLYGFSRDIFSTLTLLSQSDVTAIVSTGVYPTVDIHYKLNEGIGPIVVDYSGNTNHGIIDGFSGGQSWKQTGRTLI